MTLDPYAPPPPLLAGAAFAAGTATPRWRSDLLRAVWVLLGTVLLGAPAGLLWSVVAPHETITFGPTGPGAPDLESTKAFIGADGSYVVVMVAFGLVAGAVAFVTARRSGPWTVVALTVGGTLAALVAARVGVVPGSHEAIEALRTGGLGDKVDLYLGGPLPGELKGTLPHLRAPWAAVAWPVGALMAYLVAMSARLDDAE